VCSVVENAPDDICVSVVQGPVNLDQVIRFAAVMALTARVSLFVASEVLMEFLKETLNPLLEFAFCIFATVADVVSNSDLWPWPKTRVGNATNSVRSVATRTSIADADVVGAELSGSLRSRASLAVAALVSSSSICGNACHNMDTCSREKLCNNGMYFGI